MRLEDLSERQLVCDQAMTVNIDCILCEEEEVDLKILKDYLVTEMFLKQRRI